MKMIDPEKESLISSDDLERDFFIFCFICNNSFGEG